jgi:hypothetical protein
LLPLRQQLLMQPLPYQQLPYQPSQEELLEFHLQDP